MKDRRKVGTITCSVTITAESKEKAQEAGDHAEWAFDNVFYNLKQQGIITNYEIAPIEEDYDRIPE